MSSPAAILESPHRAGWPDFAAFRPHAPAATLSQWIEEAFAQTRRLFSVIDPGRLSVPMLPIVNPPLWELGHVAYFHEFWVHRRGDGGAKSLIAGADRLYDSAKVAHDSRWQLDLPDLEATWRYLDAVKAQTLERLDRGEPDDELAYFVTLCVLHQDMHNEAFTYMWHTLGYPLPVELGFASEAQPTGDMEVPAGKMQLGPKPGSGFVFDNEKWGHEVDVPAFAIARAPVTNAEFLAFVEDGGQPPRYWRKEGGSWQLRRYDRWLDLPLNDPAVHVSWQEAQAYCAWAKRRLPTEAEWERATPSLESTGQVWEWTASRFLPYPGFSADPYQEYSEPWFSEDHRVLRGGSYATPRRLMRSTFRNFFKPQRADVFCGFRTCSTGKD